MVLPPFYEEASARIFVPVLGSLDLVIAYAILELAAEHVGEWQRVMDHHPSSRPEDVLAPALRSIWRAWAPEDYGLELKHDDNHVLRVRIVYQPKVRT